ncbi:response regulator [Rufibacter sp. DG15C]|uniref:response regulator n=1 Tax=Rufibacter sp. DG15C TaxID=1379909 RepID=UPI00082AEBE6|nr:response regulator [Rufibacter sp. DG15C]
MVDKVLLIDDDEIALMLSELVLELNGFAQKVVKLTNGKQGLDFFENLTAGLQDVAASEAPSLVFLDLNMPIMNGWDFLDGFLRKYQVLFPETRVVVLSSTVDPEDFARAKQYDFVVDFLNKPLSDEALSGLRTNSKLQNLFHV